jgi:hypothetical protein
MQLVEGESLPAPLPVTTALVAVGTLPAADLPRPQIAISPDASHVAYATSRESTCAH